jgi:hypothetical protein
LLRLALNFFPISFDTIPVHDDLHYRFCAKQKCST